MGRGPSLSRRLYLWLTTSERTRRNRVDYLSNRQLALSRRDRIQRVNDAFYRLDSLDPTPRSVESRTLDTAGRVGWAFLVAPALVLLAVAAGVGLFQRTSRQRALDASLGELEGRAEAAERRRREAVERRGSSAAELESAKVVVLEDLPEDTAIVQLSADTDAWVAKLKGNNIIP